MYFGIAINLRGGCLKCASTGAFRETKGVYRAEHRGLDRLDRVVLVMRRRGWAGEVVDTVYLELERLRHIVANELEIRVGKQVSDVAFPPSEIIIKADYLVAFV